MNTNTTETTKVTVGTPATIQVGSDRYGATVIEVSPSGKTIKVQRDQARAGGLHVIDPKGVVDTVTLRIDGTYRTTGRRGCLVHFGKRNTHMDPHF